MTERIDHASAAVAEIDNADIQLGMDEFAYADLSLGRARVHATLALVEQQRIANVISLMQMQSEVDERTEYLAGEAMHTLVEYVRTPATPFSGPDEFAEIRADIKEALGLS